MQALARSSAGFTLIELIMVMSVVAVLLTIGVPSFKYVTSSNRASTEINTLLGDMQFARAEAIREGRPVKVCASTDSAICSNSATWNTGWVVLSGTTLLRVQSAFAQDSLTADNTINSVSFSREGFTMGLPGAITFTLHDPSTNAQYTRCLSLSVIGALSTQIGGKTTAAGGTC
jgi:type IV fimbrial biogenesis protein FimT